MVAELGVPVDWVEYAPGHRRGARIRAHRGQPHRMVVGGSHPRRTAAQAQSRRATRRAVHEAFRDDARAHGAPGSTSSSSRIRVFVFDDATYLGDAYPAYGWAAAGGQRRGRPRHRRGQCPRRDRGRRRRQVITPDLCEGQSRADAAAGGYATIERSSCRTVGYLNDRLATYLIRRARRAAHTARSLVEAHTAARHTARRASASCRWTWRRPPSWRDPRCNGRLDPRAAGDNRADPRRAPRAGAGEGRRGAAA